MQLVIKVDLDKTQLSLPEIFKRIGEEVREETPETEGVIHDARSHAIGDWALEAAEQDRPNPLESSYRAAAMEKYRRSGQIEVDRFAQVSAADKGAFVQGWLFVANDEVSAHDAPPRKPPQSISSTRSERRIG